MLRYVIVDYTFRYLKYQDAAAKGSLDPSKLPPSEDAALQHCLRVFLQVSIWKKLDVFCLDPCDWGWRLSNDTFEPIPNTSDCAPQNLLKFVRCKCKTSCSSNLCSCKKHGLSCVPSCKNCNGSCENVQVSLHLARRNFLYVLFYQKGMDVESDGGEDEEI